MPSKVRQSYEFDEYYEPAFLGGLELANLPPEEWERFRPVRLGRLQLGDNIEVIESIFIAPGSGVVLQHTDDPFERATGIRLFEGPTPPVILP